MSRRPPPMTDPETDLTAYRDMPLEVGRFLQSDLVTQCTAEAVLAALSLWATAWHARPAGSLSNNDRSLARAAGFGRSVSAWLEVKDEAMRGWVECSDGLLYHPVVAEKVRAAWDSRLQHRYKSFCAAIRTHNRRNENEQKAIPEFEKWIKLGKPSSANDAPEENQQVSGLFDEQDGAVHETRPRRSLNGAGPSREQETGVSNSFIEQGLEGKGLDSKGLDSKGLVIDSSSSSPPDASAQQAPDLTERLCEIAGVPMSRKKQRDAQVEIVTAWLRAGHDPPFLSAVIEKRAAEIPETETLSSLAFFDGVIARAASIRKRRPPTRTATAKRNRTAELAWEALMERIKNRTVPPEEIEKLSEHTLAVAVERGYLRQTPEGYVPTTKR